MTRVCEQCRQALPVDAHVKKRFCDSCLVVRKRMQSRRSEAQNPRQRKRPLVKCRQCDRVIAGGGRTRLKGLCYLCLDGESSSDAYRARRAAERVALGIKPAVQRDGVIDWGVFARNVAVTSGAEVAELAIRELNKHRRLNGLPEVRL